MDHAVAPEAMVGQHVGGRYRLVRLISSGAGQHVFEADDELLSRRVAVKLQPDGTGSAQIPIDNPDLARVLDGGEHAGIPYVVMELADDPTQVVDRPADHTSVMPVPLTPMPESEPDRDAAEAATAGPLTRRTSRRALVGVLIGLLLLVLAMGVAADDGDLEAPTTTVPVTAEASTTTVAPTTTSAPAPPPAPQEGKGKGHDKGSRGDDD